ncbi:YczE/YyaS/YitT family protein [Salinibacillus xinjiangensis]|uniref:YitT family protein n=1 Tax=Salinibacillus xinjiangensis TaxID=1229268 RepID=A0A6G1X4V0_9BACI|nr:YitT family protein [Salinibacillus xinjiangensis]MRG85926.1 YitT family protein [Salinibacillus xinjiangensis]
MKKMSKSFLIYFIGIVVLAFGISLMIRSQLGASPYDALLVGLYRTFGLTIGSWEIIVGAAVVLLNAIASKSRPEYLAMLTSLITGIGIDTWLWLFGDWLIAEHILEQSLLVLLGTLFTGIGIGIYLESSFAPNPMDRSMVILTDKTGWSFSKSRAIISIVFVIVAFFFDGAIGIGTLLNALLTGVIIQWIRPYVLVILHKQPVQKANISQ